MKEFPSDVTTKTLLAAARDTQVGKHLAKRYLLESCLADGVNGRIYEATDTLTGNKVAVKMLKKLTASSEAQERYEKRFLAEARIGLELNHPNIVPVRSLHKTKKGRIFFIMDYCPGRSLKSIILEQKYLSLEDSLEICSQVLRALDVAHQKGIVHRDIKPGNIMIDTQNNKLRARILDFGIAKIVADLEGFDQQTLTRTGYIIGTTRYMAPEQIRSEEVGPYTDIYAVGVLLHHLVSGVTPFFGSKQKILRAILKKTPLSVREAKGPNSQVADLPLFLDAILVKALSKNPRHRFRGSQEFLQALQSFSGFSLLKGKLFAHLFVQRTYQKFHQKALWFYFWGIFSVALLFFYFFTWSPYTLLHTHLKEAQVLAQKQNYSEALTHLEKAQEIQDVPELRQIGREIFFTAYQEQIKKGNYSQAKVYLEQLSHFMNQELMKKLILFFQEEEILEKVDEAIEKEDWEKAEELLSTSPSLELKLELELYPLRQERKQWIQEMKSP